MDGSYENLLFDSNQFFTDGRKEWCKAFGIFVRVVPRKPSCMVPPEDGPLLIDLNEMLLSVEAMHCGILLVIDISDVNKDTGLETAELRLVRLKSEQAHLLGHLRPLNKDTGGV